MKSKLNRFFLCCGCVYILSVEGEKTFKEKLPLKGAVFLGEYLALLRLGDNADDIIGLFII